MPREVTPETDALPHVVLRKITHDKIVLPPLSFGVILLACAWLDAQIVARKLAENWRSFVAIIAGQKRQKKFAEAGNKTCLRSRLCPAEK
ncbi:hypothetical protein [Oligosphaera ethanolica]|uniref:Uncharacterized protein n=1 Tax=Oligosphaera ethanolica TaxID=760260 RepID=A0AAE3VDT0_9BACT|nr:hypothetical protein [Oligosphaera ethanolica]MDQ0288541.1 hypothetical protein [Oligosphaera ethanolica]